MNLALPGIPSAQPIVPTSFVAQSVPGPSRLTAAAKGKAKVGEPLLYEGAKREFRIGDQLEALVNLLPAGVQNSPLLTTETHVLPFVLHANLVAGSHRIGGIGCSFRKESVVDVSNAALNQFEASVTPRKSIMVDEALSTEDVQPDSHVGGVKITKKSLDSSHTPSTVVVPIG
ncbi:unnamed protein product [Linum trigynum]|uniref:Uncharacterized protein n=1 Tax=Linum trigynum TaxID=586398 RepID=A0AAV2FSW3_9ROSI